MGAQPNPRPQLPLLRAQGCRTIGMRGCGEGWCSALTDSCPAMVMSMAEADPHEDISAPCLLPSRDVAPTPCQKSDKKGKEQNRNLELVQAGYRSCSGLRGEPCGAEDAPNPFAQGNLVGSMRSIFDPCCSARASASVSSQQSQKLFFIYLSMNLIIFIRSLIIPFIGQNS